MDEAIFPLNSLVENVSIILEKLSNWEYIIFSMTFEIAGSRDIGLYSNIIQYFHHFL